MKRGGLLLASSRVAAGGSTDGHLRDWRNGIECSGAANSSLSMLARPHAGHADGQVLDVLALSSRRWACLHRFRLRTGRPRSGDVERDVDDHAARRNLGGTPPPAATLPAVYPQISGTGCRGKATVRKPSAVVTGPSILWREPTGAAHLDWQHLPADLLCQAG